MTAVWRWCRYTEWFSELAYVPLAVAASWSLLAVRGVPMTHDGLGLVFIEAYRRAYLAGDWFPTWTPFADHGHGSAMLILYHRLHAQLAAIAALKTGTVLALKLSIPPWLVIGAAGMRRLCRFHDVRPWVAWLSGALLMTAHYTVDDWYVRGATAEMVAFMLFPWGLRHAYEIFDRKWGAVRLAFSTTLIFLAHMMTCYFFLLTAAAVMLGGWLRRRASGWRGLRSGARRGLAFGVLLVAIIGPHAAAVTYAAEFCGIGGEQMRKDDSDYLPWRAFFADENFSWTRCFVGGQMTFEIGRWILLCLGLFLVLSPVARRSVWRRTGGLALIGLWCLALQHAHMWFWFELLPGAEKIQFSTRLLVPMTVIALVCMAIATEGALRSQVPVVRVVARVLPVLAAVCQGNMTRGMQSAIWGLQADRSVADAALADEPNIERGKLAVYTPRWQYYLPRRHGNDPPEQPFLQASPGCLLLSRDLTGGVPVAVVERNVQIHSLEFTVFGKDCTVKLDQLHSTLLRAALSNPGEVREADDGTTVIDVPTSGTVVRLDERSIWDLAKKWFFEKVR